MASATAAWDARNILNTARLNPAASRFKMLLPAEPFGTFPEPSESLPKALRNKPFKHFRMPAKPSKTVFVNPLRTFRNLQGLHCERAQNLKPWGNVTSTWFRAQTLLGNSSKPLFCKKSQRRLLRFRKRPSGRVLNLFPFKDNCQRSEPSKTP